MGVGALAVAFGWARGTAGGPDQPLRSAEEASATLVSEMLSTVAGVGSG